MILSTAAGWITRRVAGRLFPILAWLRHGRARQGRAQRPGPVCVVGLHSAAMGIGEGARALSSALRAAGAEVIDWDVTALFGHERQLQGAHVTQPPADAAAVVIHLNPHELVRLVALAGAAPFKGRFCVGYWAWELEVIPARWRAGFRYVDEVWAPSRFVADAVAARAPPGLPVRVLPHPLPSNGAGADRAAFGLPEGAVVVLTVFDARSGIERKNPIAAVRAFRRAVAQAGVPAVMLCKAAGCAVAPALFAELQAEVGEVGDVRLMTDHLSAARMSALVASADIIVSLHRSEGFGLVPAQAMLAAKAVVATGWSGNLEFMSPEASVLIDYTLVPVHDRQGFYRGGRWAEADIADAADKLAALLADASARQALGACAAKATAARLNPLTLGSQARTWLSGG